MYVCIYIYAFYKCSGSQNAFLLSLLSFTVIFREISFININLNWTVNWAVKTGLLSTAIHSAEKLVH